MFLIVTAGFLGFITFESNVVSAGKTWYVGSGAGNDSSTIQGGITLANPGDTVYVYSGTYNEHVVVDWSINLTGENRDTTTIDGGGSGDVVYVTSDWVNITGFTVRNGGDSPFPPDNAGIKLTDAQNCRIFNNNVLSNADDGIQLSSSSNQNIIENNNISNNGLGISSTGVKNNNITNNVLYLNGIDISFNGASYNNIISNSFSSSEFAFSFWGGNGNSIIGNNIIDVNQLWFRISFFTKFINNNVSSSKGWHFQLYESSYFNIIDNNFSTTANDAVSGIILIRSSGDNITNNNFFNSGIYISGHHLFHFNTHTIPDNNIVNGKPLYYYKNSTGGNIDGIPVGQLILANCSDFNVKNLQINNTFVGIQVAYSQNVPIKNNTISNNLYGIILGPTSTNNITNNMLFSNSFYGFVLHSCSNNNITNNTVTSSYWGIHIYSSSSNNSIYHNKFINNTNQACDETNNGNQWDNGYPSGGNYWSDFDEPSEGAFDDYQGPDQDDPISGDGIVDKGSAAGGGKNPYVIDSDSQDNYPLMELCENYNILKQGWNLISIPLIQLDQNLTKVLEKIDGYYDAVQLYNISDTKDPWKHHKVGKSFGNDLFEINETMGFWIHITQPGDTIFLYNGIQPTGDLNITLRPGWNLVGYPSLSNKNRTTALNNIIFHKDINSIWTYNAKTKKWKEISDSDYFEIGKGYWIHSLTQKTWQIPL